MLRFGNESRLQERFLLGTDDPLAEHHIDDRIPVLEVQELADPEVRVDALSDVEELKVFQFNIWRMSGSLDEVDDIFLNRRQGVVFVDEELEA